MSLFDSHTIPAKVSSDSNQCTGGALVSDTKQQPNPQQQPVSRAQVAQWLLQAQAVVNGKFQDYGVIIAIVLIAFAAMFYWQNSKIDKLENLAYELHSLQSQVETLQMAMDQDPTQVEESAQLEQTEPVIMMSTMPMSGAGGPKL